MIVMVASRVSRLLSRLGDTSDCCFQYGAVLQYHAPVGQGGEIGIHSGLKTRRR